MPPGMPRGMVGVLPGGDGHKAVNLKGTEKTEPCGQDFCYGIRGREGWRGKIMAHTPAYGQNRCSKINCWMSE